MIDAAKARSLTYTPEEIRYREIATNLEDIEVEIKKSCRNGLSYANIHLSLGASEQNTLRDLGYEVEPKVLTYSTYYLVSWEEK